MVQVKSYTIPPTRLVPNSPFPLLHYPGLISKEDLSAPKVYDLYTQNGWQTQWIFRYGSTQQSHYHSQAHECMTVLSGTARIRFGVADTVDDLDESTYGSGKEAGGIEIEAKAGDVFVLPAGTAHKTFDTSPAAEFALLTPGSGKEIAADDARRALEEIQLDGFTMMGSYPQGSQWDFAVGKENDGHFERTWAVPRPERDPVLGKEPDGICGKWRL